VARTQVVVIAEGIVVDVRTTTCHHCATYFGTRLVAFVRTAGRCCAVTLAIVAAASVRTNSAAVFVVATVTSIVAIIG
jgi:hypothetical protein